MAKDGTRVSGPARDLSMAGTYVQVSTDLSIGDECQVEIRLTSTNPPLGVNATASVVRAEDHGVALEFSEIPLDTFDHLRNLVLYNAQNPGQVEREFSEHIGLKRRD